MVTKYYLLSLHQDVRTNPSVARVDLFFWHKSNEQQKMVFELCQSLRKRKSFYQRRSSARMVKLELTCDVPSKMGKVWGQELGMRNLIFFYSVTCLPCFSFSVLTKKRFENGETTSKLPLNRNIIILWKNYQSHCGGDIKFQNLYF